MQSGHMNGNGHMNGKATVVTDDGLEMPEKVAKAHAKAQAQQVKIEIPAIKQQVIAIPIKGVTPMIQHRFSEKGKRQMLEAMQTKKGEAKKIREPRDPQADFIGAIYHFGNKPVAQQQNGRIIAVGEFGMPAIWFKKALVSACRFVDGVPMTMARQLFHVIGDGLDGTDGGDLVKVVGSVPWMREDTVRNDNGSADLRYRPQWDEWSAVIRVKYNPTITNAQSIVNLLNLAGTVGVGENRPEKSGGSNGMFEIDTNAASHLIG